MKIVCDCFYTKGRRHALRNNRPKPIIDRSCRLFVILQKCDEKDEEIENDAEKVICIDSDSSDAETSVEFVCQTTATRQDKQVVRNNRKIADLKNKLQKEKAKNIELTGIIGHEILQINRLPINDAINGNQTGDEFVSNSFIERTSAEMAGYTNSIDAQVYDLTKDDDTVAATLPTANANDQRDSSAIEPPSSSTIAIDIESTADSNDLLDTGECFSDSFVERTAAEIEQNPDAFDAFLQLMQE